MGDMLTLLMRLMHLYRTPDGTGMMIMPPHAILKDLFADILPEDHLVQVATTISMTDLSDDLAMLRAVGAILAQLGPLSDEGAARIARSSLLCDTLQAIRHIGSGALMQLEIHAAADLFRFVEQCAISPTSDMPTIILVGGPRLAAQSGEVTVSFPGDSWAEKQTEIAYTADQPFPRINTSLQMMQKNTDRLRKTYMLQRPGADFDLDLYNNRERKVGSLQTRELIPPFTLRGARLAIAFSAGMPLMFLETRMFHAHGKLLGQVVRVIPHT
jgi:hypothetical protein